MSKLSQEMLKRDGEAMGIMEDCYPQLLQTNFICNTPMWIQISQRIFSPFLPKRVVSKFDFIAPHKDQNDRNRLLKFISEDNLPVCYGGKYEPWPVAFPPPAVN